MAKKSQVERTKRRIKTVERYAEKRAALRAIVKSAKASPEERDAAQIELQKLPRNANPVRVRNRCRITGRSRGYLRKFEMSRIKMRELAHLGELPGVTKSSW